MNKPVVERITLEQLQALLQESQSLIQPAIYPIDLLLAGKMGKLASDHQQQ